MKIFNIDKIISNFGDYPALIQQQSISYNKYLDLINGTIQELKSHNIHAKDRIAIYSQNTIYHPIIVLALIKLGAIAVPVNTLIPANKIEEMLASVNCQKIIHSDNINLPDTKIFETILPLEQLIQQNAKKRKLPVSLIPLDQEATIIFTSGSSGKPKAVLHTFGNHYFSALGSNENILFGPGDRWLLSLPLYHVGGLSILFRAIVSGGTVVVPDKNLDLINNIKKKNITHISLVATQLYRLLQDYEAIKILKNLKAILVGGSFIPSSLIEKSFKNKLSIFTTYGSTEMASQITTTPPGAKLPNLFTAGKCLKYRQIKIANDGEILVRGDTLFKGYVESNKIDKPFSQDGWFRTGDLGKIDINSYLSVKGRKDNMFISGGENIHPEEIEKLLLEFPGISQVLVLDISDPEFGSRPIAFVECDSYQSISDDILRIFLSKQLPRFKIPDAFYRWPLEFLGMKPNRKIFRDLVSSSILI